MKKLWIRYAEKIDNANLRERALMFFAAAFVLVALLNTTLVSPLLAKQRRVSGEIAQMQSESRLFQDQIQTVMRVRREDPDSANRQKLQQLRQQFADYQKRVQERQGRLVPPDRIANLLEDILTRNRRLEMVSLKTLPVASMSEAQSDVVAKALARGMFRHGVEIKVKGGYLDLLNYVGELEKLPQRMYWTKIDIAVDVYPEATMTLAVYTLSLDKNWLVV
ncbi:MAG TPA: MSHA biogenesis protein MshJ [Burkholderiales bacterium]|nr:MSHA biogenesis protein MshJ [Burkholderiales bacterium]